MILCSSNDALDKTYVSCYVARAELILFFVGRTGQSFRIAMSMKSTMH